MPSELKSLIAFFWSGLMWLISLNVQDIITFALATAISVCTLIYIIIGIQNRYLDKKIKEKQLEAEE